MHSDLEPFAFPACGHCFGSAEEAVLLQSLLWGNVYVVRATGLPAFCPNCPMPAALLAGGTSG